MIARGLAGVATLRRMRSETGQLNSAKTTFSNHFIVRLHQSICISQTNLMTKFTDNHPISQRQRQKTASYV